MRVRAALLVLPLLTTVAACGGSSGPEVSKADYLASADTLCTATKERIDELEKGLDLADPDSFTAYLEGAVAEADSFVTDLDAIRRPSEDSEKIEEILLTPLRNQVEALEEQLPQIRTALADGGVDALGALDLEQPPQADTVAMREYGFSEACLGVAANE